MAGMRAMRKSTIGFGMVIIPIKLYTATKDASTDISLHQYHSVCGSRVAMPKTCPKCLKKVPAEEMVKGYELDAKHFVPITEADMATLPLSTLHNIQIEAFVKGDIPDPRFIEESYFISPEEVGAKAFVLFTKAMEAAGVIGIAKYAMTSKECIVAIRPFNGVLLLQTLRWSDELRDCAELIPAASVSEKELAMGGQLIKAMTGELDLASFKDNYREAMLKLIQSKLEGKPLVAPVAPPKKEADLFDALMASLAAIPVKEPVKA
jgi:DNA end-binding protein Ku